MEVIADCIQMIPYIIICAELHICHRLIADSWSEVCKWVEGRRMHGTQLWEVMAEVISRDRCHAIVDIRSTWFEVWWFHYAGAFWKNTADVCGDGLAIRADAILKVRIGFTDSREIGSAHSPKTCEKKFLMIISVEQRSTPILANISHSRCALLSKWTISGKIGTANSLKHTIFVFDAFWCSVVIMVCIVTKMSGIQTKLWERSAEVPIRLCKAIFPVFCAVVIGRRGLIALHNVVCIIATV